MIKEEERIKKIKWKEVHRNVYKNLEYFCWVISLNTHRNAVMYMSIVQIGSKLHLKAAGIRDILTKKKFNFHRLQNLCSVLWNVFAYLK
jgi:hypothetical protein